MSEGDRRQHALQRFHRIAVKRAAIELARNVLILLHQNGVDSRYEHRLATRQKHMLDANSALDYVYSSVVVFVYRQRDIGRLMGSDDCYRAKNALLQLTNSGLEVDAHAPRKNIEKVTAISRIPSKNDTRAGENLEAASTRNFKTRVSIA